MTRTKQAKQERLTNRQYYHVYKQTNKHKQTPNAHPHGDREQENKQTLKRKKKKHRTSLFSLSKARLSQFGPTDMSVSIRVKVPLASFTYHF